MPTISTAFADLYPKVAQDPLIAVINKQGGPDVDDPLARILEDIQRNPGSKNNPPPEPPRAAQPAAPIPTPKPPPASAGRGSSAC